MFVVRLCTLKQKGTLGMESRAPLRLCDYIMLLLFICQYFFKDIFCKCLHFLNEVN